MKKVVFMFAVVMMSGVSSVQASGGAGPCLATCFLGDSRIGLYMNDGKFIEKEDWIVFGGNIIGSILAGYVIPPIYENETTSGNVTTTTRVNVSLPLGSLFAGFDAYKKSKTTKGFCAGFLWGRRVGSEINTIKVRNKEILRCIPIVNLYPCIAIPMEAYRGKTMTQVIEEEGLKR